MKNSEKLRATLAFVEATERLKPAERTPIDPTAFVKTIEQLPHNPFGSLWTLFPSVVGKRCPAFEHGLTMAQSAGVIEIHYRSLPKAFSVPEPSLLHNAHGPWERNDLLEFANTYLEESA